MSPTETTRKHERRPGFRDVWWAAAAFVAAWERSLRLCGQDFVPSHLPGQEAVYGHAEHMRQKHQLEIGDPADTQLDPGNDVAGNIPAGQLTLCRQHGLRPSPARAKHANLRADNVARFLGGVGSRRGDFHTWPYPAFATKACGSPYDDRATALAASAFSRDCAQHPATSQAIVVLVRRILFRFNDENNSTRPAMWSH